MHALNDYTESLARCDGMFRKVIMGHWVTVPTFVKHAAENKFAAYNFPQGIVSHLYRAAAGRNPVVISEVGLETFADPRHGGGKLNEMATEDYVTIVNIDGREFLQYKTPKIDVCFIRGTTADPMGNITSEKEAAYIDALTLAMATRANGGVVIAQVERLSERKAHCKKILVPGLVVDYIVVDSHQEQTYKEVYHPAYSGETVLSANLIPDQLKSVFEKGGGLFAQRGIEHYAVARRAAEEIKPGYVVNIGIGMAGLVPTIAAEKDLQDQIFMTNEAGTIGGIPLPAAHFGASLNPMYMTDMPTMFDFYDGGILDLVCVGAAQIDQQGSVNVGLIGRRVIGVGGFTNLTAAARKVVFLTTFTDTKGLSVSFDKKKLTIRSEGRIKKFVNKMDQISFSGKLAARQKREIIYVTERCVFRLTPEGIMLTEIAPGVDLDRNILSQMEFQPLVDSNIKIMSEAYFRI
ncbi:hypothetical protein JCM12294_07060 [Desulfocicer niacini]